jgi:hypothetical protein
MFVIVTGLFIPLATVSIAQSQTLQKHTILDGSVAVQASGYVAYPVVVEMAAMSNPRITGHVTASGGSGNDIVVKIFTESDFMNWQNNHSTQPLFDSGQITATELDVPCQKSGTYYVILSNAFSSLTPKTVEGKISLTWALPPSGKQADASSTDDGLTNADIASLVGLLLLVAAIGGLITWLALSRKKKRSASEVKP